MSTDPLLDDRTLRERGELEPDDLLLTEQAVDDGPRTRRRRGSVIAGLALGWIIVLFLAAVFANLLPIPDPAKPVGAARMAPFTEWGNGLALGTDNFGRSNLSRVIYGARASMMIGIVASVIGLIIGGFVGLLSGYRRGWVDRSSSFAVDVLLAFPPLVFLITLTAVLTPKLTTLLVGLSIVVIPTFVRLERAAAMAWAERPFVLAARSYGSKDLRIAVRHVLPNSVLTLVTYVPTVISALIVAEGSLSFLGLGLPSPTPSWGGMIAEGKSSLRTAPSVVFVPAVFVFLTVLAFNLVGERVRARFDSRRR